MPPPLLYLAQCFHYCILSSAASIIVLPSASIIVFGPVPPQLLYLAQCLHCILSSVSSIVFCQVSPRLYSVVSPPLYSVLSNASPLSFCILPHASSLILYSALCFLDFYIILCASLIYILLCASSLLIFCHASSLILCCTVPPPSFYIVLYLHYHSVLCSAFSLFYICLMIVPFLTILYTSEKVSPFWRTYSSNF